MDFLVHPPKDAGGWSRLDTLTDELDWQCPHCEGNLHIEAVATEDDPNLFNIVEAICETCDAWWFPPDEPLTDD